MQRKKKTCFFHITKQGAASDRLSHHYTEANHSRSCYEDFSRTRHSPSIVRLPPKPLLGEFYFLSHEASIATATATAHALQVTCFFISPRVRTCFTNHFHSTTPLGNTLAEIPRYSLQNCLTKTGDSEAFTFSCRPSPVLVFLGVRKSDMYQLP